MLFSKRLKVPLLSAHDILLLLQSDALLKILFGCTGCDPAVPALTGGERESEGRSGPSDQRKRGAAKAEHGAAGEDSRSGGGPREERPAGAPEREP